MLGEVFDPESELLVSEHFRPHWSQAGCVVFVTFRTNDSIPSKVVESWDRQKQDWLRTRGKNADIHWSKAIEILSEIERKQFNQEFNRQREIYLDSCQGECVLKRPEFAKVVADALLHFDRIRYCMGDFVVMPNHVHLLAAFPVAEQMQQSCRSWLRFTATRINRMLSRKGKFWQQEPFDHLVRNLTQYEYLRHYIEDNPRKAGLKSGDYFYRKREE